MLRELLSGIPITEAAMYHMADPVVPTPQDTQLAFDNAAATLTASGYSGVLDIGSGFAPGGAGKPVEAVLDVSSIDSTTGNETYAVVLQESSDNGSSDAFAAIGASVTITAAGVVLVKGFAKERYLRLSFTLGGTTPIIVYQAWMNPITP